ncbi:MAG: DMT family transporter, partial [Candidatus Kapaibacteriota bacterium]
MIGELSALTASILWSISPYIFSAVVSGIGSFNLNISRLLLSSLLIFATCLLFGISLQTKTLQLFYLILSGLVGLVLGDTFLFKSFKEIGPRYTMILMSSNPAFGAIIAYFTFGEVISFIGIVGMIVTFLGICLVIYQQNSKEATKYAITFNGIIFGLLASIGQAGGLILTKYASVINNIHPLSATFYRIFPSFVILGLIGLLIGRINSTSLNFLFNKRIIILLIIGSIIGPYLGITFSYIAVAQIHVGIAATIMSLQPVLML